MTVGFGKRCGVVNLAVFALIAACAFGTTTAYPAFFYCHSGGELMSLDVNNYNLPDRGLYLVGFKNYDDKVAVVDELKSEKFTIHHDYLQLSLFSALMTEDNVKRFLKDDRVAYVECSQFYLTDSPETFVDLLGREK